MPKLKLTLQLLFVAALIGCSNTPLTTTTNTVLSQQCDAKALEKYKEQRCLKLYQKKICFLNSKDPLAELETDSNTQNAESYFEATDGAKIITQLQKKCISNGGRLD